jgi:RNA recognition motif-containing protein
MELYRLFIGGLDSRITKEDIREALHPLQPSNLHTKKSNNRNGKRGNKKPKQKVFAFFEVPSLETARRLTQQPLVMRGKEYYCQLSHKSLKNHSSCMKSRVYLKYLPTDLSDQELINILRAFG